MTKAFAYLRTSSAANVGPDKDSDKRQRTAIKAFAAANGYEIVGEFYDAAVSGADPVNKRPGFLEMWAAIARDGCRTILVESPDRFARDLMVQLTGHDMLKAQGIQLVPTSAPDFFTEETTTAILVRQVLGAIMQFEKGNLVAKLAGARERYRKTRGKVEGRKSHAESRPDAVKLAKKLYRRSPKTGRRRSLRAVAAELAMRKHVNGRGKEFSAAAIRSMVLGRRPAR